MGIGTGTSHYQQKCYLATFLGMYRYRTSGRIIRPFLIYGVRPDTGFELQDIRTDNGC
jgi:hypothetical protein